MINVSLKKVAAKIAEDNTLSEKDAQKIINNLSLKELKVLASLLKTEDEKNTIEIVSSDELSKETKKVLLQKFNNMRIKEKVDKNLGAGIKIKAYDMIYDLTLKGSIGQIVENVEDSL